MGLFDAFEVDGDALAVPDDVTGKKPGRYPALVKNVRKEEGVQKDGETPWLALVFEYEYEDDKSIGEEWFFLPNKPKSMWDYETPLTNNKGEVMTDRQTGNILTEGSQNEKLLGYIKKRLLSIGVPEARINQVDPLAGHVNGIEVVVTLVKNNRTGYTNIKKGSEGVVAKPQISQTLPGASSAPAASGALSAIKW